MHATGALRKKIREHMQSTAKEKAELVAEMIATKTELKHIKDKEILLDKTIGAGKGQVRYEQDGNRDDE